MPHGPTCATTPPIPAHLAGVPGAGLGDVALIDSLPAGHSARLVLHPGMKPAHQEPTGSIRAGSWIIPPSPAPHLAALAAEPIAAHRVMGQRALLAAVPPALGTLLPGQPPVQHVTSWHITTCHTTTCHTMSRHVTPHHQVMPAALGPLTASEPQSHSSPASTKPLPHSGGSRSCQDRVGGHNRHKRCRGCPQAPCKGHRPQGIAGQPPSQTIPHWGRWVRCCCFCLGHSRSPWDPQDIVLPRMRESGGGLLPSGAC